MDFFENLKRLNKEQRNCSYREYVTLQSDYGKVYDTESGQRILHQMIERSHLFDARLKEKKDLFYDQGAKDTFLQIMEKVPLVVGRAIFDYCKKLQDQIDEGRADMMRELDEE